MQEYNYNPDNNYNNIIDNDEDIFIDLPDGYSLPWICLSKKTYNKLYFLKKRGFLTEHDFYSALIRFSY